MCLLLSADGCGKFPVVRVMDVLLSLLVADSHLGRGASDGRLTRPKMGGVLNHLSDAGFDQCRVHSCWTFRSYVC